RRQTLSRDPRSDGSFKAEKIPTALFGSRFGGLGIGPKAYCPTRPGTPTRPPASMTRREPGCRQHVAGQTCRNRACRELLLPGLEIVDGENDVGVLGDGLAAGVIEDDV